MMLEARNLFFGHGARPVLQDISFALQPGQTVALIGDNGAGKTTLLRCLAGLEAIWGGEVLIAGQPFHTNPRAAKQRLGYVRDLFGLYDDMTAGQFLSYIAATRQVSPTRYKDTLDWLSTALELAPLLERDIRTLTRGMRQKVALAQAFVHDPDVLLLDEPASGLDPSARVLLSAFLNGLRERGKTTLVSSHILGELEQYTNAVLLLKDGKVSLLQQGTSVQQDVRILSLQFTEDVAAWADRFAARFGVAVEQPDSRTLRCRVSIGEDGAAQLLRWLVQGEWPLAGFTATVPKLAEFYHLGETGTTAAPVLKVPA